MASRSSVHLPIALVACLASALAAGCADDDPQAAVAGRLGQDVLEAGSTASTRAAADDRDPPVTR